MNSRSTDRTRHSFGYHAWLQPLTRATGKPGFVVRTSRSVEEDCAFAVQECRRGLGGLYDQDSRQEILLAREPDAHPQPGSSHISEAYTLSVSGAEERLQITVTASDSSGLLYGVYDLLGRLRQDANTLSPGLVITRRPAVSMRVLNHWDNLDGSVERGYAGSSLFLRGSVIGYDLDRLTDYARLLSSTGINRICLNNVNVTHEAARLITDERLPELARVADIFRPFGIRLLIAVHFESPVLLGGLTTPDPVDTTVAAWWERTAASCYHHIPDLAGFLVKADSEFRSGPATMGRTQAEGANVIARALAPYGGIVFWRCFVYNCQQDWRDTKTDRPKAAYEYFHKLDGQFDRNVILQIKHGPMDFQVREPNSPLLGAMPATRQAVEFQITQEYTGQQIDLYALPVQWEEVLNHPVTDARDTRDLIGHEIEAVVAVANTGTDANWTGHLLAQANLYAYGHLAWDPKRTANDLLSEWTMLTFGADSPAREPILDMLMRSRHVYEQYNAPLGIGWMVKIHHHYGPSVDGYEYMKWGTYHRADHAAIGVDRTRTGTGFTAQYHPAVRDMYENLETCPEKMLLFFHRLPYDYTLSNGSTILQYIYDTHFEGAAAVEGFIDTWRSLKAHLPEEAYESVMARLVRQRENAREWRDVVNTYFFRKTGIDDTAGRKIFK